MTARDALVGSAIDLVRRNGVAGTGLAQLLEHSGISRRSVYLNFPGGKAELVAEATRVAGRGFTAFIEGLPNPLPAVTEFVDIWKGVVEGSDFAAGCPIVAAALGRSEAPEASDAAGEAFADWEHTLSERLREQGMRPEVANSLATTIIAAIEGAVVMSIATRSTDPLDRVGRHLAELVDLHARPVRGFGPGEG